MAYTGWNRFGSGKYWPELVGPGWNMLAPDGLFWNRFKPVQTYVKRLIFIKSSWPTPVETGLEVASTGQIWLEPDGTGCNRFQLVGTGLNRLKPM